MVDIVWVEDFPERTISIVGFDTASESAKQSGPPAGLQTRMGLVP
jgi:hypothetical protein